MSLDIFCEGCDFMGMQVYQEDYFKVYRAGHQYIVHNSRFDFKEKHSHIRNLKTAKQVIYYVKNHIIPRKLSSYLMQSLIRVSGDEHYIKDLEQLIEVRERKGRKPKYHNSSFV